MNIHLIAIGGSAMHNLALELHKKGYQVTGSDDEIFEPSKSRLEAAGLLPEKWGWYPERITSRLDAVILGMHAREDNPELQKAQELGIPIYSYPEYLYEQTKNKLRVIVGGSHGKTTTTSMIMHVLKTCGIEFDYMAGALLENVFPTFENYVEQFALFTQQITPNGKLIYYENDENLRQIASRVPASVQAIPYTSFPHYTEEGTTYLAGSLPTPIQVFGEHNLQNISAAYLACKELGIDETAFLKAIATYKGAAKRLQKIAEQNDTVVFLDFAHSPSKLQATIKAVREQYPRRKLIACMELHTFSSLNAAFLPQYRHTMDLADEAIVFFNPEVVKHKRLPEISSEDVRKGFDDTQLKVFTDNRQLLEELTQKNYENSVLLIMTSGNFSGIDIKELATQLIHK